MKNKFIVDASVLAAAGFKPSGESYFCTSVINLILQQCRSVIVSNYLQHEWNKHCGIAGLEWQARMQSRSKKGRREKIIPYVCEGLLDVYINDLEVTDSVKSNIVKDLHLIEASLWSKAIILSCEYRFINLIQTHLKKNVIQKEIYWLNPSRDFSQIVDCIKNNRKPGSEFLVLK